jgi:ribosomal protein S18 acetylase RimI-like enzyme
MWRAGAERTRDAELADLIAAGQIAVADRDGRVVGCVQVHDVSPDTASFGMLATDAEYRGGGVGRALVDFAEERSRDRGIGVMQLELLVPRTWRHPHKEFLRAWYLRLGYRLVRTSLLDETHPHLMPQLATECDLTIYQKPLTYGTTR